MVVFQITINGQPYCTDQEIRAVTLVAESMQRSGDRVSIHARASADDTLQWLAAHLGIGDEVNIRIVEAVESVDTDQAGCSFCGRDLDDLHGLIVGRERAICSECSAAFAASLKNGAPLPLGASLRDESEWTCAHCGRRPPEVPGVVVRNAAAICPECLRACSDMLDSRPDE